MTSGRRKVFGTLEQNCLGCVWGHQNCCCLFGSLGKQGSSSLGMCPFGGLRRSRLCPSGLPENPSPRFPIVSAVWRCCCGFCRAGVLQVLGSRQPLVLPVQQGWNVGSEFIPTDCSSEAALGAWEGEDESSGSHPVLSVTPNSLPGFI